MDERDGRERAVTLGIRTIGMLGVLLTAKHAGGIAVLKDAIAKLRQEAGFLIARPLEARLLGAAGE